MVGFYDPEGLFLPEWFYDSINLLLLKQEGSYATDIQDSWHEGTKTSYKAV